MKRIFSLILVIVLFNGLILIAFSSCVTTQRNNLKLPDLCNIKQKTKVVSKINECNKLYR